MLEAGQSEDAARNARTLAGKGYEPCIAAWTVASERWRCLYG